jgi:hypothetical protein
MNNIQIFLSILDDESLLDNLKTGALPLTSKL